MKKQPSIVVRGKYLLPAVGLAYVAVFIHNSNVGSAALQKSFLVFLKILPIILMVILLTSLINFFLKPKQIARKLGKESGVAGWLWTLLAGVLSHGPMYAWYPLINDLRGHGMRDGLVVTFFASRAIKLPLLPMMIDYFGWLFTLVLSIYIIAGSLLQGIAYELIERRD
ncbi:MAG: permease [Desulfobulbus sp.]|nr:MAG: permease [Desulfobulbus sp.]